jgi:ABC-type transport system involved in multi-copper enzyme maturation permease subunit
LLWYKAWLETRARFLASLLALTSFCGLFAHHALAEIRPEWNGDFQRLLYSLQEFMAVLWVLSLLLVGMGGVVHEKVVGTSSLTLSFPVSRGRLQTTRVGVGVLEAVVLAVMPWLTILAVSARANMPISITQVGFYVLLLISGGLVYFAIAVLVSSMIEGTYTAPAAAIGLTFLSVTMIDAWFKRLSLWRFVTGNFYIDPHTFRLSAHFPWPAALACLSLAALMLFASVKVIQHRDF